MLGEGTCAARMNSGMTPVSVSTSSPRGDSDSAALKILVVADADSRLKWSSRAADALKDVGETDVDVVVVDSSNALSDRQIAEVSPTGHARRLPFEDVLSLDLLHYDVIIPQTSASRIWRIRHEMHHQCLQRQPAKRPVFVCGYQGAIIMFHLEGLLWRIGSDVICVNTEEDDDLFRGRLSELGYDTEVLTRVGFLTADLPAIQGVREGPIESILFAVQAMIPARVEERRYILRRLVEYAQRHPDRRVKVKLRALPDESTPHPERHHYFRLYEKEGHPPGLVEFVYGTMTQALAETDVCITVSSTAAVESFAYGVRTLILTDFGVGESVGNHYFLGSGCLGSFDDLLKDDVGFVRPEWLERHGLSERDSAENLATRVQQLLDQQRDSGEMLPLPPTYYRPDTLPYILSDQRLVPVLGEAIGLRSVPRFAGARRLVRRTLDGPGRRLYRRVKRWSYAG